MSTYRCFECGKEIKPEYIKKKIRCPYCGFKVLYKSRGVKTSVEAV